MIHAHPSFQVCRVMCNRIQVHVPFTNLRNKPIQIVRFFQFSISTTFLCVQVIGTVEIDVSTATDDDSSRKGSGNLLDKLG